MSGLRGVLAAMIRDPAGLAGLAILGIVVVAAVFANEIAPDPFDMLGSPYEAPFGEFLLGTDSLGRSIAAGIVYGGRVSLAIGLITAALSTTIGVLVGGIAGYVGGAVDTALMRLTEFFQTIPAMMLAIVVIAIMQPSVVTIVTAIVIVSWAPLARLARAEFLSLRNREFVLACRVVGMSHPRIMLTQILPNAASSLIVAGSITVATAILYEAGLSFLGLSDPNVVSWGMMVGQGRTVLRTAWWISAIPGFAILLTVLAINLVGDCLNEVLGGREVGRS